MPFTQSTLNTARDSQIYKGTLVTDFEQIKNTKVSSLALVVEGHKKSKDIQYQDSVKHFSGNLNNRRVVKREKIQSARISQDLSTRESGPNMRGSGTGT